MPEATTQAATTAPGDARPRLPGGAPLARSPIRQPPPTAVVGHWEVSRRHTNAALRLADLSALAKVVLRAAPESEAAGALGVPFGAARRVNVVATRPAPQLVVGSGPDEWTVLGPVDTQAEIEAALLALPGEHPRSVVDLTHGRALVRLTGAAAPAVLATICAIDLRERSTPNGKALRSLVAGVATDLVRDDVEGTCSYLLHVERSSGQYLYDTLMEAGATAGIDAAGLPEKEI